MPAAGRIFIIKTVDYFSKKTYMGRSAWFEEPVGIKICPLSMGDREDPTRLVFTSKTGAAVAGR